MNTTIDLWNPFNKKNHQSPHPMYDSLREEAPVYQNRLGHWILTRSKDVRLAMQDPRFEMAELPQHLSLLVPYFEKKSINLQPILKAMDKWLLLLNPPEHTRLRSIHKRALDISDIDKSIKNVLEDLFEKLKSENTADLVKDYAKPFPSLVAMDLIGLPREDYIPVRKWADDLVLLLDPLPLMGRLPEINKSATEISEYLKDIIAEKRKNPGNNFTNKLMNTKDSDGNVLNDAELISALSFMVVAGTETTTNFIGCAIKTLLQNPEKKELLVNNPENDSNAIEELLRYESPTQLSARLTNEDITLEGVNVPKGSIVFISIAAANRDHRVYPNPHELDFARQDDKHIAFGSHTHLCLGAKMARIMSAAAIPTILRTFPKMKLGSDFIERDQSIMLYQLKKLPVVLN